MSALGYRNFYLCAHDRGARVAHKLCVDHPTCVSKAIFLDIAPPLAMYDKTDFNFAKAYYHWFFLIQDAPYPETLISASPETLLEYTMGGRHERGLEVFEKACYESYLKAMRNPAAVHAMCEDYRAGASIDLEDHKKDNEAGRWIQSPLMVLWGKHGVIEKRFQAVEEWEKISSSTVVGESLDCGHFIPEEAPEALLSRILDFFKD
ncbi:MAG: hypothetical protein Q9225_006557 [Loekoesia sp. 1 TL-2023]